MSKSALIQQIHRLVDEADESQLDAALEVLRPSSSKYSKKEIESFYRKADLFEQNEQAGLTVKESHDRIRQRFKDNS